MNEDFSKMTDDELEGIIRLHENSSVAGSRFDRATTELNLRYKKRGYQPGLHFEVGGDMTVEGSRFVLPENHQMTAKVSGNLSTKKAQIIQEKTIPPRTRKSLELAVAIMALLVALISIPWWPKWFEDIKNWSGVKTATSTDAPRNQTVATSTINISDILSKVDTFATSLERQNFLDKYKDATVYIQGSFNDINKSFETYYVYMDVGKGIVGCALDNVDAQTERKLLLLKSGDGVSFSGVFTAGRLNGVAWYVKGCTLLK